MQVILRLCALLLLLWTSPAGATVTFVDVTENNDQVASATTITVSPPAIAVGNLVIVYGAMTEIGDTISSVADDLGNTYTCLTAFHNLRPTPNSYIRTCYSVAAFGGSSPTITVNFSGTESTRFAIVKRYAKTGTGWTFDGSNRNQASAAASPASTGTITTTAADLLVGMNWPDTSETTAPAGWTRRAPSTWLRHDDLIGAAINTYNYQPTWTGTNSYGAEILAFTETGTGGAANTTIGRPVTISGPTVVK